jgi:hypothetical protein
VAGPDDQEVVRCRNTVSGHAGQTAAANDVPALVGTLDRRVPDLRRLRALPRIRAQSAQAVLVLARLVLRVIFSRRGLVPAAPAAGGLAPSRDVRSAAVVARREKAATPWCLSR